MNFNLAELLQNYIYVMFSFPEDSIFRWDVHINICRLLLSRVLHLLVIIFDPF